jgi:hypothetical protein
MELRKNREYNLNCVKGKVNVIKNETKSRNPQELFGRQTQMKFNTSMTRPIFIIVICFLAISCNQNSKEEESNPLTKSTDSLNNKKLTGIDTTEIDFVESSPDKAKILLENEYVRVIEYSLKPGEKDSTHTHPPKTSYVISGGMLRIYPENEKSFDAEEVKGKAEWADKRGKHYVENIGKTTVTILLTEIKTAQ